MRILKLFNSQYPNQQQLNWFCRSQVACVPEIWSALSASYRFGQSRLANYPNTIRIFNGLALLGRNLVSVDDAASVAWESGAVKSIFDLLCILILDTKDDSDTSIRTVASRDSNNQAFYDKFIVSCLQFFSNLAVQAGEDATLASNVFSLFIYNMPKNCLAIVLDTLAPESSIPLLLILEGSIRSSSINALRLCEEETGQMFLKFLARHSRDISIDVRDIHPKLVTAIVCSIINFGYMPTILLKNFSVTPYLEPQETANILRALTCCLPVTLESASGSEFYDPSLSLDKQQQIFDALFSVFQSVKEEAVPLIETYDTRDRSQDNQAYINSITGTLSTILNVFDGFFNAVSYQLGTLKPPPGSDPKGVFQHIVEDTNFLASITGLLHSAETFLPKRNKLADMHPVYEDGELVSYTTNPAEFPRVKTSIIALLAFLATDNRFVQDEIRRLHALELILSNMIIDQNNPYIKENSILALSCVLKNNQENQDFISKLEVKEVVANEELENAGMEVKFVNGKVRLMKKD